MLESWSCCTQGVDHPILSLGSMEWSNPIVGSNPLLVDQLSIHEESCLSAMCARGVGIALAKEADLLLEAFELS